MALSPSNSAARQAELGASSALCRVMSSLLPGHGELQNVAVATQKKFAQPPHPTQKTLTTDNKNLQKPTKPHRGGRQKSRDFENTTTDRHFKQENVERRVF